MASRLLKIMLYLAIFLIPSVGTSAVFKCIGTDGSLTFSDTPCATSNEKQITVDGTQPNTSSYHSDYEDGYSSADLSQSARNDRRKQYQNSSPSETEYIDIPDRPERPGSIPTITTSGDPVILTGSHSAIDSRTGKSVPVQIHGRDPYKEYREANRQREIAIEAEKHRANNARSSANPMLCAEYRMDVEAYDSRGRTSSNRSSSEANSRRFKREKALKKEIAEKKRFLGSRCR